MKHMGSRRVVVALVVGVVTIGLPSALAYPRPGTTERVSLAYDGGESNGNATEPVISSDGRVVAFETHARNLVPGDDDNRSRDVIVYDRDTGEAEKVSVSSDGEDALGDSDAPSLSADGQVVVFESLAAGLVPDDTNKTRDILVHDRATGETERVSVASDGAQATDRSFRPSISGNGRFVTFESMAPNLVADDTNQTWDVFVHDRVTGTTERVSVASDGREGRCASIESDISHDGRYVVFRSFVSQCLPGQTDGTWQLFVHDRENKTTERIPLPGIAPDSIAEIDDVFTPAISGDGRFIAFFSYAPNLVPADTNGAQDIFVYDRETGTTERVSVARDGMQSDNDSLGASISPDGRYVGFYSLADLATGPNNGNWNTYVHDRETGATERISITSDGAGGNHYSFAPSLSTDARFAAFDSFASDLVPDGNAFADVFVRDRGPSIGVGALEIEMDTDRALVSGTASFAGATLTGADDPEDDGAAAVLSGQNTGAEITGASIVVRPEQEDLLLRLRLADLPAEEDPGVGYRWSFDLDGTHYEVRAFRAAFTGASPGAPHFSLYTCDQTCSEQATLRGGIGTVGNEVRVAVPSDVLDLDETDDITAIIAASIIGEAASGDLAVLDDVELVDATIPTRRVSLGIAPRGAPVEDVVFDPAADLSEGAFSGSLDLSSVAPGAYEVWANACLGSICGAQSRLLTVGNGASPTPTPVVEATKLTLSDGSATSGQFSDEVLLQARLQDAAGGAITGAEVTFELTGADSRRIFSTATDSDGVAAATPILEEKPGAYQLTVRFAADDTHEASSDTTGFVVDKEDTDVVLSVEGKGSKRTLEARLSDRDTPSDGIDTRFLAFYADGELIGSATTDGDGTATLKPPPRYRGGNHDFEARFEGDDYYSANV